MRESLSNALAVIGASDSVRQRASVVVMGAVQAFSFGERFYNPVGRRVRPAPIIGAMPGSTLTALVFLVALVRVTASEQAPSLLDTLRKVAPHRLEGAIPAHFSEGAEQRARDLQALLFQEAQFFQDRLGIKTDVTLAVLNPSDWKHLAGEIPYGFPFVRERVVFLPFKQEGVVANGYLRNADRLPARVQELVRLSGRPFPSHVATMVDLIGFHELGHTYASDYGIRPHARWLGEMLATYFGYAFMAERRPDLARSWDIVAMSDADIAPKHRSLADFERLYMGVGPENYVWYQGRFAELAAEISRSEALEFIRKVKASFPRDREETLTPDAVLERLERIRPSFRAWAASLNGRVPQ